MLTEGQEHLVLAGIIAKSQKGHGRGGRTAHPFFLSVSYNVAMGSQTEQFMRLADGSYNPQLGSSDRLRVQNGAYTLPYKDGTTLTCNTAGNIASLKSQLVSNSSDVQRQLEAWEAESVHNFGLEGFR